MSNILERLQAAESPHQQLFDEAHAKCDNSGDFDTLLTCYLVARAFPAVLYAIQQQLQHLPKKKRLLVDPNELANSGKHVVHTTVTNNFVNAVDWAAANQEVQPRVVCVDDADEKIDSITRSAIGFAVGLLYEAEIDGALPEKFIGNLLDLWITKIEAIRKEAGND